MRLDPRLVERLARARVVVDSEPLVRVHLPHWETKAVQRRANRFHAPFCLTFEPDGVRVICRETEWAQAGRGLHAIRVETGYRMITLDVEPHAEAADLLATITDLLQQKGISVHPLPTFHRDRLLVHESRLEQTLRLLQDLQASDPQQGLPS
ncbi:MAG: hypothetical protein QN172_01565 [Armatimonadota bacterium]|nr:hypothetical protein [Armatimonadota bacterium]MDR7439270.1 hypothetical protein [Armatimonadota bacterium]MDR7562047.1 hypothetical protein [Armatimonadota bacterium]MDR7567283.1 hypothetical protein [Armatimonadota bacterium]MDR7601126.1 hypothetical protein [Armatimonadota bacterium]